MFLAEKLKQVADLHPDRIITSFKGRELRYGEFYSKSKNLAKYFQDLGYVKNDIIALCLRNSDSFLISYYACQIGGFTVLPVNTKLTVPETEYILNHSEAKGLIYDEKHEHILNQLDGKLPAIQNRLIIRESLGEFEEIIDGKHHKVNKHEAFPEDTAVIFYTSGTTGRPKGVMLSNNNIKAVSEIWSEALEIDENDRMLITTPLFHCAACHVLATPVIYSGGMVIIQEIFSPDETIQLLKNERATLFFGVPAMYNMLLNNPTFYEGENFNLRTFCSGAAPLPFELMKKLKKKFPNTSVLNIYGQTENAPAATILEDKYALLKAGSVGVALPQTEMKVINKYEKPVNVGEVGEIAIKGPQVMKGYLRNKEETQRVLRNGWLLTGDLGRIDDDGLLYIVDRRSDMIIRGGENIYPVEIEEVLYAIPEVLEATVVGIPDELYGEIPLAFIVTKDGQKLTEQDVFNFCKGRLASYKLPSEVKFLKSLPRNASGKVLKTRLRDSTKLEN